MNKRCQIIWESQHFNFPIKKRDEDDDDDDFDDDEHENAFFVNTPFGIFPVNDEMNPMRRFEFWVGHTNFDIGEKEAKIINDCEGVEFLRIITRYRFMLAVGRSFNFSDVAASIQKELCPHGKVDDLLLQIKSDEQRADVFDLINNKISQRYWLVYVKDDDILYEETDNLEEYGKVLEEYTKSHHYKNGILITYDDE